ncbi:MAG: preprotein translocase subunit SecE [Lentisphaerae bacterium GWF2_44_16]|nr:MAG: preprotein translocase subunit SecE [Lentisphaerae bacterium GWF2_44_16]
MNNWLGATRQFLSDTMAELRKCSWPSRAELFESTILMIVAIAVLALYVAFVDEISRLLINFLTMK